LAHQEESVTQPNDIAIDQELFFNLAAVDKNTVSTLFVHELNTGSARVDRKHGVQSRHQAIIHKADPTLGRDLSAHRQFAGHERDGCYIQNTATKQRHKMWPAAIPLFSRGAGV
jgi:hypothetical protein